MGVKYLVAADGTKGSERAFQFALARAEASGATILLAHVLEWSRYAFLTPTELEERHKRRTEELERAREAILAPMLAAQAGHDVAVETVIRHGHVADTLSTLASEEGCTQIFVSRAGEGGLGRRLFGSVASALAQSSPVPCTIVP